MQWHNIQHHRVKGSTKAGKSWLFWLVVFATSVLSLAACGPSSEEIDRRISEGVQLALAQIPTSTPIVFPTPLPTATPSASATPSPTVTPQPTPTPQTFPPTPTPVLFPPTPTPLVLPPTPTAQPILDFSQIYQRSWPSVFLIEADDGRGSGWLIEPGLILTNEHVVRGSATVVIRQASSPPFSATVLAVDSWRDIALLRYDPSRARLPSNARVLQLGEVENRDIASALLGLGYSGAGIKSNGTVGSAPANVGVLSQITDFGGGRLGFNLVMDAPNDPGDSGGPVLDSSGQVVGMIRAAQVQNSAGQRVVGTFYAVHVDEIRASLPTLKRGQSR